MSDDNYVWVFNGDTNMFPSAAFASLEEAEIWIAKCEAKGTLTKYPLGVSVYDWAISNQYFHPKTDEHTASEFISNFSSAYLEHHHYE